MGEVARLAELNDIDLALDATKARLTEIERALQEPAVLRAARADLAKHEAELEKWHARQLDCELQQKNATEKIAKAEQKLYDGKVTVPKELDGLQRDLAQLRRQLSTCEDELLEVLIQVEELTSRVMASREAVKHMAADHAAQVAALKEEQTRLVKRLGSEKARQASARAAVPQRLLPTYDALRARRGGRAVAALEGDTCSVCLVAVSPTVAAAALQGEELVYCENCGRLLFAE